MINGLRDELFIVHIPKLYTIAYVLPVTIYSTILAVQWTWRLRSSNSDFP